MMERFLITIDSISEWSGKIFGFLVVVIACLATLETILRYCFDMPTNWGGELTIYLSGILYIIGGAYVLKKRANVVVDALYVKFPLKIRTIVDVLNFPILLMLCLPLIIGGAEWAWSALVENKTSGTVWNPPTFPVLIMIPLAALLMVLQGFARFIRDFQTAFLSGKNEH